MTFPISEDRDSYGLTATELNFEIIFILYMYYEVIFEYGIKNKKLIKIIEKKQSL